MQKIFYKRNKPFIFTLFLLLFIPVLYAQQSVLTGKVSDARTQESLPGVSILIKELPGTGTVTDIDGNYSLTLPAGTYTIQSSYISYATMEITKVEIKKDKPSVLHIDMKETTHNLGEVIVVARKNMEAEKALMTERQHATVAVENIGAKEMSIKGLSTVADGIKKITGISMEGNSKVYVRGLGDRYSMTSLNGFPIASPNPDNKLIPLTLFPTSVVKNISVSKVYQPSVAGDYSGAHINVDTKENIGKDYFSLSFSTGGKINTIFSDFYSSDKSGASVPFLGISNGLKLNKKIKNMSADDFEQWQRTNQPFKTNFSIDKKTALPAISLDLGMAKSWKLKGQDLNVLFAANFNNDYTTYDDAYISTINAQGIVRDQFSYDKYSYETTTTLVGQIGYTLRKNDRVSYNVMFVNNTEDSYMRREGFDAEGIDLIGSNSIYHIYTLWNNQLTGRHELHPALSADWQLSYGTTSSDEPDRRQVMFTRNDNGSLSFFKLNQQETMRYFGELSEDEYNGDLKLKYKFNKNEDQTNFVRIGTSARKKSRDYYSANFYYNLKKLSSSIQDIYHLDEFLNDENIANGNITVTKNSQPRNKYFADLDMIAAFIDMEYYPAKKMLVSLGVRYEHAKQKVKYWGDSAEEKLATLTSNDLFPALNIKYTVQNNQNLRLGISRTVTRPSFVEMAPFEYKESYGGATIRGNNDIQNGYNYNADIRYELFHGLGDMYSFGIFYKYLDSPIERVQEYSGSLIQSFLNVDKGTAAGAEIEIRKYLTKVFKIDFNASYIYTHISLPEKGLYTDKKRQLQGASPYLINLDLNYAPSFSGERNLSLSAVYNLQGPRISSVGINDISNVKEKEFHSLDFISGYSFANGIKVKLQAKNLLQSKRVFTQKIKSSGKNETVESYRKCMDISLGFSMEF